METIDLSIEEDLDDKGNEIYLVVISATGETVETFTDRDDAENYVAERS